MSQMTHVRERGEALLNVSVRVVTAKVSAKNAHAPTGRGFATSPVTVDAKMANSDHARGQRLGDGDEVAHAEAHENRDEEAREVHVRRGRTGGDEGRDGAAGTTTRASLVVATRRGGGARAGRDGGGRAADGRGRPASARRAIAGVGDDETRRRGPLAARREGRRSRAARPARSGRDAPSPRRDASTRTRRRGRAAARESTPPARTSSAACASSGARGEGPDARVRREVHRSDARGAPLLTYDDAAKWTVARATRVGGGSADAAPAGRPEPST